MNVGPIHRLVLLVPGMLAWALFSTMFCSPQALAQVSFADAPAASESLATRDVAAEARKELPTQPEDRGDLLPLHTASVLSWLCRDSVVQNTLGTSRAVCYQEFWPMVARCQAALQQQAPAAQNRTTDGRMDVVSFRSAVRACLVSHYAAQRLASGRALAGSLEPGVPDPLAARMGGSQKSLQ